VHLDKNIPMGAGLGGGSSDAAVFLSWLNARAGERALPKSELSRLALTLGADVPFFLGNEPAWVTGIGEKITPVSCDLTSYTVLVVCPEVHRHARSKARGPDKSGVYPGQDVLLGFQGRGRAGQEQTLTASQPHIQDVARRRERIKEALNLMIAIFPHPDDVQIEVDLAPGAPDNQGEDVLGLSVRPVAEAEAKALELDRAQGLLVVEVSDLLRAALTQNQRDRDGFTIAPDRKRDLHAGQEIADLAGQGIGFAIPSDLARQVIEQLKEYKSVKRGWLGVSIQNVDENSAKALGLEEASGALVSSVTV